MEKIIIDIRKSRDIKEISLKNYLSSLKQLNKKINGTTEIKNLDFLKNYKQIFNIIDDKKETTQKNYLTSIIVALKAYPEKYKKIIDIYSKKLKTISEHYHQGLKNQQKTETQKKNWMTYEELLKVLESLKKKYNDNKTFNNLQKYLILLTYINHPLRNDYAEMKIIKYKDYKLKSKEEQQKYNYLIIYSRNKYKFFINQFKNKERIGCREILITNKELIRVIKEWLKINKSGWFFVKKNKTTPQTPNSTTKFLNTIFKPYEKKISSSMIRHIIISNDTKNEPTIKELEDKEKKITNKYLHSSKMNKLYRKIEE